MKNPLEFQSPPLLSLLSEDYRQELLNISQTRTYLDGQAIHFRGDYKPGLSIIRSGSVLMSNVDKEGNAITTTILGVGQSFGEFTLFAGLPRTHDAFAVGETKVAQIQKVNFDDFLAKHPDLCYQLLVVTTKRLHEMLEFTDDLRRLPLEVNIAKLLLNMSSSSPNPCIIKCSQSDIALTLGVTRASINRVLSKLEKKGLLTLGYGQITIRTDRLIDWIEEHRALSPVRLGAK